jgi:hypothetical protein
MILFTLSIICPTSASHDARPSHSVRSLLIILPFSSYLFASWSRVLLEKLIGFEASQEIPRIYGTRKFITVLTSARQPYLSWARSIQSPQSHPTSSKYPLNIIFPSTSGSPQCSLSLRLPHQHPVYTSTLPHTRHIPSPSHTSWFYHPHNIG